MAKRLTICLILVMLFSAMNASAVTAEPSHTDWIVTGEEVVENETITLAGNLIVKSGGSLTLRNVTLIIDNSYAREYGISVEPGSSMAIYDSTLSPSHLEYGFFLYVYSASFVMKDSEMRGAITADGDTAVLDLVDLQNAVVDDNVIKSVVFLLNGVRDSVITNNTFTALEGNTSGYGGFFINNCQDNTITDNYITGVHVGMSLDNHSTGNFVANNELSPGSAEGLGHGIFLHGDSNNNVFVNNEIHGPGCTAFRVFTLNNLIEGNTVYNMRFGVVIARASGNIVANNSFSRIYEQEAVLVYRSSGNYVINNSISSSVKGIALSNFSRRNIVQANTISGSQRGILVYFSSDDNLIANNEVSDNQIGITIYESSHNKVYSNNLVGNAQQAYDDSSNDWSLEERGNYWSDYEGRDGDGDGVGGTPYYIPPEGADEHPLMKSEPVVPAPVPEQEPLTFRELYEPPVQEVTHELKLENQEILLENSYLIKDGGSLILENVTINSSGEVAKPYEIVVQPGGSLLIHNSKIIAPETGESPIHICALEDSTLVLKDSELHHVDAGMHDPGPTGAAIEVRCDGAVIENNVIVDSRVGVCPDWTVRSARIVSNTFSGNLAFVTGVGPDNNVVVEGNIVHDQSLAPTVKTKETTHITAEGATLNLDFTLPSSSLSERKFWWPPPDDIAQNLSITCSSRNWNLHFSCNHGLF